jgi:hypothetical protein
VQYIPVADLRHLRGFTQELHQVLYLYCGVRNRAEADREPAREDEDSDMLGVLLEEQPAEKLRHLLEISNNLSETLNLDALMPKMVDSLFVLFRQADRCFVIQAEEDTNRLLPRVVKALGARGNQRSSQQSHSKKMPGDRANLSQRRRHPRRSHPDEPKSRFQHSLGDMRALVYVRGQGVRCHPAGHRGHVQEIHSGRSEAALGRGQSSLHRHAERSAARRDGGP